MSSCFLGYTLVASKEVGIGVPKQPHDEDRGFFTATCLAASLFVPPFLAARMGGREARRFPQGLPGTPTRSSCRPQLALGAAVVANRSPWRPMMAESRYAATSARVLTSPRFSQQPVVQTRRLNGRYPPNLVVNLRWYRADRERLQRQLLALQENLERADFRFGYSLSLVERYRDERRALEQRIAAIASGLGV